MSANVMALNRPRATSHKRLSAPLVVLTFLFCGLAAAGAHAQQSSKPKLRVAVDGFPAGHDTPEGVATDLARAFINRDAALFSSTSVRLHGSGAGRASYARFLHDRVEDIKQEAAKKEPSPFGPKTIGKVFAARRLTRNGPASYGYAAFGFQDVMFVDVGVYLQNGETALNRTLVIKDRDGKWYVHPDPRSDPLLSQGLNDEKPSVQDFSEVYEIQK